MKKQLPILLLICTLFCCSDDSDDPAPQQSDTADVVAEETQVCLPKCDGLECGDDGCGGICGFCSGPFQCSTQGLCECVPQCDDKNCGDDQCGGICGECATTELCSDSGVCECIPQCDGKECGDDSCGGVCGTCPDNGECSLTGQCQCIPECDQKACGDDGCGNPCGVCPVGLECNSENQCVAPPGSSELELSVQKLQFGGQLVGSETTQTIEIRSVGEEPLKVTGLSFALGSNPNFTLDLSKTSELSNGLAPSPENPLVIAPLSSVFIVVSYTPDIANPIGEDGKAIFDTATLKIESDAAEDPTTVLITGLGVTESCPKPVILIPQAPNVLPQTILKLFGDNSTSTGGDIVSWKWSVSPPKGASVQFVPDNTFPNPTVVVNAAGTYEFALEVTDITGKLSCVPITNTVTVTPKDAIYVELLWNTPADPDPNDEGLGKGADLDVHLVHTSQVAPGPDLDGDGFIDGWFDTVYDCWQLNPTPNWGSFDPSVGDNPILARSDGDGVGPEIIRFEAPETATYKVGVQYWNDHAFGPSTVAIKVWIYGTLNYELKDVKLSPHDLLDVARIKWPSGQVVPITNQDGSPKIIPNYYHPDKQGL